MTHEEMAELLESVKVLPLREGDRIVFRAPMLLRTEQRESIRSVLDKTFPKHEVLVLDGGCDLDIIRPE